MNAPYYPGKLINTLDQWTVVSTEIMTIFKQVLCRGLSQVIDGEVLTAHNIKQLSSMLEFGNFEVDNLASYPYNVNVHVISYLTIGVPTLNENETSMVEVSGIAMLPEKIKGVIIYFHGTSLAKNEVPSNPNSFYYKYCLMLASQGYLIIAPDYIGQGVSHDLPHPYFSYPEYQGISGLYIFKALHELLDSSYCGLLGNNIPSYVYGHSEGATSGSFFIKIIQNGSKIATDATTLLGDHGFVLEQAFLDSGIFDFKMMLDEYIFSNIKHTTDNQYNLGYVSGDNPHLSRVRNNFNHEYFMVNLGLVDFDYNRMARSIGELLALQSKPIIMLYWLNGFCYYNDLNPDEFLNCKDFLSKKLIENIFQLNIDQLGNYIQESRWSDKQNYTLSNLFITSQNNMSNHELGKIFFLSLLSATIDSPSQIIETLFALYDNSLANLINYDKLKQHPKFEQLLEESQTILYNDWNNNIPTIIMSLDYDSVVNPKHSDQLYQQQLKNSKDLQIVTIEAHNFWTIEPTAAAGLWSLGTNDFPCFLNHSTVQPYSLLWMLNKLDKKLV